MPDRHKTTGSTEPAFDGQRLRRVRDARGISARRLAEETGISIRHIWRLEANARPNVRAVTLAYIAQALDTSIDYLVGLTDEPTPRRMAQESHS